ncbi:hypothetical protein MLD38_003189 [Melastoma candidum]|uniref:Uncharacterized protein n=1 Tax=Melastoma candidum TaxID=119954 RepID=A0ACB9S2G7_9MYRT|nr:hypothetical protein MLD38_003189 [Melastoma candidum]
MFTRASAAATNGNCTCSPNPTTTIVLYTQSIWNTGTNTNYTSYSVAGIQGTDFGSAQYGTINVFDNPLTIAASPTSALIGRFRSIYVVAALGGDTLYISGTFQFTEGRYANSTLNVRSWTGGH